MCTLASCNDLFMITRLKILKQFFLNRRGKSRLERHAEFYCSSSVDGRRFKIFLRHFENMKFPVA